MTQEAVPDETVPTQPADGRPGAPKGLLQQMEELMAALNADLSQLDADLQPRDGRPEPAGAAAGTSTGSPAGASAGAPIGAPIDAPIDVPAHVPVDASVDGGDAR
ncbi:hypothetical protein Q3V23_27540 [Streptomyces sp. VNUA116]|uniref:hypothetical protein n=1 Tax=Streptomyces sp. VNUA116 TaxID=3062449 RepID=UPI002675CFA1|nr:hypothetical protein [Streptomyces sp. VNUA116]WKU49598.1 hypothetical protein Q3V23_27540 [Streptomyces sp. VNUA116]